LFQGCLPLSLGRIHSKSLEQIAAHYRLSTRILYHMCLAACCEEEGETFDRVTGECARSQSKLDTRNLEPSKGPRISWSSSVLFLFCAHDQVCTSRSSEKQWQDFWWSPSSVVRALGLDGLDYDSRYLRTSSIGIPTAGFVSSAGKSYAILFAIAISTQVQIYLTGSRTHYQSNQRVGYARVRRGMKFASGQAEQMCTVLATMGGELRKAFTNCAALPWVHTWKSLQAVQWSFHRMTTRRETTTDLPRPTLPRREL
jgi:hypothetical protein